MSFIHALIWSLIVTTGMPTLAVSIGAHDMGPVAAWVTVAVLFLFIRGE